MSILRARKYFWAVLVIASSIAFALWPNGLRAASTDDQVKRLAELYNQIEGQLNRSIHYLKKEELAGATTIEQAWINGAADPIKISVEHVDAKGRELKEYFARDLADPFAGFAYEGMFLLTRKETPLPDGGTQVEESRKYFGTDERGGNGVLLRELRKSARFRAGEPTDTVRTPNVVVDLHKEANDDGSDEIFEKPADILESLRKAGPPDINPFVNVKGDSDKFRVIHGTASPDGRYAIALGFARSEIDWAQFVDREFEPGGAPSYYAENEEDIRNYVVDLARQKILGETGCNYFGTRRRYNHRSCAVTWSADSTKFVQLWDDKWASTACVAGEIDSGPKFAGAVDLDKAITKKTYAFVRRRFDSENGGELTLDIQKVNNDGVVDLEAWETISGGERKGETEFHVSERLRLREMPTGLRLDLLNMRRLPKE